MNAFIPRKARGVQSGRGGVDRPGVVIVASGRQGRRHDGVMRDVMRHARAGRATVQECQDAPEFRMALRDRKRQFRHVDNLRVYRPSRTAGLQKMLIWARRSARACLAGILTVCQFLWDHA